MSPVRASTHAPLVLVEERDPDCGQGRTGAVLVGAVAVLVVLTLFGRYPPGAPTGSLALDVTVALLACGLLPALLRRPVPAAVARAVLAAVSPAATPPATFATVLVAQRRPLAVAAAVGAVGVLAHGVQGLLRPTAGLDYAWWLVLTLAAHAALVAWGALTRARRALLASLRERGRRA